MLVWIVVTPFKSMVTTVMTATTTLGSEWCDLTIPWRRRCRPAILGLMVWHHQVCEGSLTMKQSDTSRELRHPPMMNPSDSAFLSRERVFGNQRSAISSNAPSIQAIYFPSFDRFSLSCIHASCLHLCSFRQLFIHLTLWSITRIASFNASPLSAAVTNILSTISLQAAERSHSLRAASRRRFQLLSVWACPIHTYRIHGYSLKRPTDEFIKDWPTRSPDIHGLARPTFVGPIYSYAGRVTSGSSERMRYTRRNPFSSWCTRYARLRGPTAGDGAIVSKVLPAHQLANSINVRSWDLCLLSACVARIPHALDDVERRIVYEHMASRRGGSHVQRNGDRG